MLASVAIPRYTLQCVSCRHECTEQQSVTSCPGCGNQLDVVYAKEYLQGLTHRKELRDGPIRAVKYLPLTPIQDPSMLVSLSEGGTPLHHCQNLGGKLGLASLFVKNEGANPTGVFKDRGSMVELTKAREMGAKAVCCASTGNMAASVAAYAAVAKLPCYVFVPEGTPPGKLAQTMSYGARIIQIRGTYADCVRLCQETAQKHGYYLAGDYAFRLEGQKSTAYEIVEQLYWKSPDVVLVPVGCGTNIAAIWKGFTEFQALGFIDTLPRMICVQPRSVPTIAEAWREGKERFVPVDKPQTVASAVGIGAPQDDIKALRSLKESHGYAETASEEEILEAEQMLSREESLFVEPSSALPIAVLPALLEKKIVGHDDLIVCIATGNGLKDPKTAISRLPDPPVLEPKSEEVDRYFAMKLYALTGSTIKEHVLFKKAPNVAELRDIVQEEFTVRFDDRILRELLPLVHAFIEKGRAVNRGDMQNIIETVLNEFSAKEKILEIRDFRISDSKHEKAKARVTVRFRGEEKQADGEGDGIFDAITNAIKTITNGDGLQVRLTDYSVAIDSPGTAAVVKVTMTLMDTSENTVIATATSPDVIVASVNAFEKGYNILSYKTGKAAAR